MPKKLTFCPICSHILIEREEGGRLRPMCDECGYIHYMNPVPGVGLLIEMDGGLVLIKRGHPPHEGEWTLPSGFVEADESAEEAAIREAEEETGLKVEIIDMAGINSFPEGPPVSGIMIFYRMKPLSGELHAGDDAADAKVFQPEDLPRIPFRTHRESVAQWLAQRCDTRGLVTSNDVPPEEFTIRPFKPHDTDEVIALLALIAPNRTVSDEQWRDVKMRLREMPMLEVFVAETCQPSPIIIGCVALSVVRGLTEGRGFINDMAVLPSYRRRGVGAKLLEALMRRAGQLHLASLMVNTHRANDQARAFYAACGFALEDVLRLKIR